MRGPTPRDRRGPLRAVFVVTSLPVGGAETLLVNLIDRLDPGRVRAEVICLKEAGELGQQIAARVPLHTRLLQGKWDLRVLPRLVRLLRRRRADAMITVGAGDKMFWGRLAAWCAGTPVIASALHSTGWPDGVGRLNRLLTPLTDGFIGVAERHGDHLRRVERFPGERVFVIRNGIDTERFRPDGDARQRIREALGIPEGAPVAGIVAALRPEKNHEMFMHVARVVRTRHPQAHFLIVGDGPQRGAVERLRDQWQLGDAVHLLGTRHDTPELLAAMDLFLLCSHNEASPVSILEAQSCQLPVVATRVGSVGESVVEGETGFLVDVEDVARMADRSCDLFESPATAQAMGRAGRQRVLARGSLESMVEGYQRLIETLYDRRVAATAPALGLGRPAG